MGITPLPRTAKRRHLQFNPEMQSVAGTRAKFIPRQKLITARVAREHAINPRIEAKLVEMIKKVENKFEGRKSLRDIRIMQALLLDKYAAEYSDYFVNSLKKYNMVETGLEDKNMKIKSEQHLETKVWEQNFAKFVRDLHAKNRTNYVKNTKKFIPQLPEIIRTLQYIRRFTKVPLQLHFERTKHWKVISKIEAELLRKDVNLEENLKEEVQRVLRRTMQIETEQPNKTARQKARQKLARRRALDIIVASSIYADLVMKKRVAEEMDKVEKERLWDYAYSEGMEKAYPLISKDKVLLREIIDFNRNSPKGKTPLQRIVKE